MLQTQKLFKIDKWNRRDREHKLQTLGMDISTNSTNAEGIMKEH